MPRTRQNRLAASRREARATDRSSLARAFRTFTQAAGSLEKSYAQLQGEVARLRGQLESANAELSRRAEENVRVRAFLTRVLESLPCGVVVTDICGRPRMVNPEARRLLQLQAAWTPGEDAACPPALEALLATSVAIDSSCEQEWVSGLGDNSRTLGVSRAEAGESSGGVESIWIIRDVSDQKRLAAEREAARRAHALAEIATVLAHEIRNPLGSMELFAGLLADATAAMPETREWVMHMQAGLRLLSATVNNVLQFHSEPCRELVLTSLDRLLRETAGFLGPLAKQRGLGIAIDNAVQEASILADPQRIQQVFFNLALNAFSTMNQGGTLTIRVRRAIGAPEIIQVDFEDQGHGIDPAVIDRIFAPGFTTKPGSPGLGLSVCHKVVEQHGGSIRVQSQRDCGTTFSIFLPVAEELHESRACGR